MFDCSKSLLVQTNVSAYILAATIAILLHISLHAQPTFIRGHINSTELASIQFTKLGVNSYLPKNISFEVPVTREGSFSGTFPISEKGMYRIGDGWTGHQVFIMPGDSIRLSFRLLKKIKDKNGATTSMPRFHKMDVTTKYPGNYTFFDRIDEFFGWSVYPYQKEHFNATRFKKSCDSSYIAAQHVLKKLYAKHVVSDTFYRYATAELDARYVLWICTPLTYFEKKTLPPNYLERIEGTEFDNNDFLIRTNSYVTAASVYNMYVLNDFDTQRWYSNLDGEFRTAATCFRGLLRDQLMAWTILDYKDKEVPSFDSLYGYFLVSCKNSRIKGEVRRKVEAFQLMEKSKPSLQTVLQRAMVTDVDNNVVSLSALPTSKRWVLVDCWATWCVPCRKQRPFLAAFERKYKDSVEFVFLSLDEKKEVWQKFITNSKNGPKNQFFVKGGFKSELASYFNLMTIPRYILLDTRKMAVAVKDMPMPIQSEGFERALSDAFSR